MANYFPFLVSSGPSLSSTIWSMVTTATHVRNTPPIKRSSSGWLMVWISWEDSSCSWYLCVRRLCGARWPGSSGGRRRWRGSWQRHRYSPHLHDLAVKLCKVVISVSLCLMSIFVEGCIKVYSEPGSFISTIRSKIVSL